MWMVAGGSRSGRSVRGLQLGLFLAAEAGWLFAWSAALGGWLGSSRGPLLGLPAVAGILVAASAATRGVLARSPSLRVARIILAALGLGVSGLVAADVLLMAGGPAGWSEAWSLLGQGGHRLPAIVAMALALLAWWRGLGAGRARLSLDTVEAGFRTAVAALALLFVLSAWHSPPDSSPLAAFVGTSLLVLFAGLAGMPLASILDLAGGARHGQESELRLSRHWMAMLLGAITVLLLVSAGLAQVLTFQRIEALLRPLAGPVDALLWVLLYAIALPTGLLIDALVHLLWLLPRVGGPFQVFEPLENAWLDELRAWAEQGETRSELLPPMVKWALAALLAALAAWLLARAVFRLADWRLDDDVEEVRDFVWSWAGLRAAISRRLRALLGRRQLTAAPPAEAGESAEDRDSAAWGARELYRALLRLGAGLGRRRAPAETPHEYERALAGRDRFSAWRRELRALTETYVQARYGAEPPTEAAIAEARAALRRLEALIATEPPGERKEAESG
jgi:hypothetical protein